VTGQVTKVHLSDNSEVKQGDVMFEIDDSLYRVAYHKAIASQAQAKAAPKHYKNARRAQCRF